MVRLLGKAIALSALMNVLHFAEATVPAPLGLGMAPVLAGADNKDAVSGRGTVERTAAEWSGRGKADIRKNGLTPVLDDQIIPDRAVQNRPQLEAILRAQITST